MGRLPFRSGFPVFGLGIDLSRRPFWVWAGLGVIDLDAPLPLDLLFDFRSLIFAFLTFGGPKTELTLFREKLKGNN